MGEMLIRPLGTRSSEEERGQNGRVGHYPASMMLEPWVRVSSLGMERQAKNNFKDIQTSLSHM